jgi:hypothetical protein
MTRIPNWAVDMKSTNKITKEGKKMMKRIKVPILWLVLPIVQSNTTSAYPIHIQDACYSEKGSLIK